MKTAEEEMKEATNQLREVANRHGYSYQLSYTPKIDANSLVFVSMTTDSKIDDGTLPVLVKFVVQAIVEDMNVDKATFIKILSN